MQQKQKVHLEDIKKREVYSVPDNYFDGLPANIRRRLNQKQVQKSSAFYWMLYGLSLASICLALLAGYYWNASLTSENPYEIISGLANEDIIDYLQWYSPPAQDILEAAADAGVSPENSLLQQTEVSPEVLLDEADDATLQDYI